MNKENEVSDNEYEKGWLERNMADTEAINTESEYQQGYVHGYEEGYEAARKELSYKILKELFE